MTSSIEIQQYMTGAWRLMTGRTDGLRLLDISADGFWNSFAAIPVALPALIVGWVAVANELASEPEMLASRMGIVVRLAIVDIAAWTLPIALLALAVRRSELAGRFVPYVVASNWGSALIVWLMLPPALIRLFFPQAAQAAETMALVFFVISMILTWRLTNAALNKGPWLATALFAGMFAASLIVLLLMQALLGFKS